MRSTFTLGSVVLAASLSAACLGEVEPELADQAASACIGFDGVEPPTFTLQEIQYVLGALVPQYSADPSQLFTGAWTNWYYEPMDRALAKLAVMRGILDRYNLWDMYLGPLPKTVGCPASAATARMADGTCNDLDNPLMGSRGIRFGRNVPPLLQGADGSIVPNPAAHPDEATLLTPNPREISRKLFVRKRFQEVPFLNLLSAAWIQFQVHDWFDHTTTTDEFFRVPLHPRDPMSWVHRIDELIVPKTAPDPTRTPTDDAMLPPSYQNAVTHWWDASQVYGSDQATADRLRSFQGGKLKVDSRGLLPVASDGFEDTGMRRNWWLGLSLLHNLFAKEHNAIADMLAELHPEWTDQQLYDKARLINAALIAKIHTLEWTPAILPNPTLEVGMNANWHGLNKYIEPPLPEPPVAYQDPASGPVLFGVVGGNRDLKNVPYTLTEEFVSVYRMHPLLPDWMSVYSVANGGKRIDVMRTETTRDDGARDVVEAHKMEDLLYSFGREHPGALVLNNYPRFLQNLNLPFVGPFDMGTVDVLRDRERGVPRYNEFRRQLRLPPLASLEELTTDADQLEALREVYGTDAGAIERVDLLVGTLAEAQRPSCYGFGETLFQVFTLMATRRLQADRFYTNDYTAEVYTPEGLAWVEGSTMKDVLLRHHPELATTGLAQVANAFYPWE